jgi:TolB protein
MANYPTDDWDDWLDERPKRQRSCWFVGMALLLVVSLLASTVISAVWLYRETAVSPTPTPATDPAPLPGRIAFVDRDGQVMTVDPDGGNGRFLTSAPFSHQFPVWSPDGARLAVIGRDAIYLLQDNAEPAEPISLYRSGRQNPIYLYWSPDGRSLSFLANEPQVGIGLRLVQADAPYDERLLATGNPFYWQWGEDSSHLLIHTGGSGAAARLALLPTNGEGSAEQPIAPPGQFQAPGISANGRFWAYAKDSGDNTSWLVVEDNEGGEEWSQRHTGMVALSWSPVGNKLAFSNGLDQRATTFWGPLRLLDAETGEATILSDNTVLAFFWSPDGRYLAVIHTGDNNRSFGVIAEQKENGRPLPLARLNNQRQPHQFKLEVIEVETGAARQLAAFVPTRLFVGQFLPFFDQYALSHRLWSPDSAAIVLPLIENGVSRVKVFPLNGDPAVDLGRGDMPFWSR